jgi:hypothetical protein
MGTCARSRRSARLLVPIPSNRMRHMHHDSEALMLRFLLSQIKTLPLTMRVSRAMGAAFSSDARGDNQRALAAYRYAFELAGGFPPADYFRESMRGRAIMRMWAISQQWEDHWREIIDYTEDVKESLGKDDPAFSAVLAMALTKR